MKRILHTIQILAALTLATSIVSCSDKDEQKQYEPVDVVRLDRLTTEYGGMDSKRADSAYKASRLLIDDYLAIVGMDTTDAVRSMRLWSTSLPVAMFAPPADSVFPDTDTLRYMVGNITGRIREAGIELPTRRYAAVVWGRNEAILFTDSAMFIALNHYLEPHHAAYSRWAEYRRALKRPNMLPYDIAEALVATQMPYQAPESGETVISRMMYEGALAEAKMRLVDTPSLANALGLTERQLADVQTNEQFIWNRLVNDKLLYSSDEEVLHRLFDLLPYSSVLSPQAPGRAARYTGWRIVQSYLKKHPETTLKELLSPAFYNNPDILREAQYLPSNR